MPGGAPIGNNNNVKSKRWMQAIDRALAKRCKGDGIAALDELAERLLQEAQAGEGWALKELGDRIDGKAAQQLIHSGDVKNPVVLQLAQVDADI